MATGGSLTLGNSQMTTSGLPPVPAGRVMDRPSPGWILAPPEAGLSCCEPAIRQREAVSVGFPDARPLRRRFFAAPLALVLTAWWGPPALAAAGGHAGTKMLTTCSFSALKTAVAAG